jgi:hypothetical protein
MELLRTAFLFFIWVTLLSILADLHAIQTTINLANN